MSTPAHEDVQAVKIVTAKSIWKYEKNNKSVWWIKKRFWEFKKLLFNPNVDDEINIQAWQYVKAYTKILKDKGEWDEAIGLPKTNPEWMDMDVESDEWVEYWKAHPKEQFSMFQYKRWLTE